MSQVEARFGHLLKPIRDLALNWDVDVASELEEYLEDIGRLAFSFDADAKDVFNFAEAALLIQGSACVYSKKVEYLYQLVYETLDLLASKKKLAQGSSVDEDGKDLDAQHSAEDEQSFLSLDDIPEDKNINLVENGQIQEAKGITRTPMVLVPLSDCEKANDSVLLSQNGSAFGNKSDFKMNTSIIHESGALLLGIEDMQYVDQSFQAPNTTNMPSVNAGTPQTVPEMDLDLPQQPDFDDDNDDNDGMGMDDSFEEPEFPDAGGQAGGTGLDSPAPNVDVVAGSRHAGAVDTLTLNAAPTPPTDPWTPLDPHEVPASAGPLNAFRRIKTYRVPIHLTTDSGKGKKKQNQATKELPLPPISQFCLDAFLPKSKSAVPKGFRAPAYKEFAAIYAAEQSRRNAELRQCDAEVRQFEQERLQQQQQHGQSASDDLTLDPLELSAVPLETSGDDAGDYFDDGPDDYDDDVEYATVDAVNGGAAAIEGMEADLPDFGAAMPEAAAAAMTFEDLVRKHIESYIAETQQYAIETGLTRRVQEWEDRIRPELEREAARKAFDIHVYGKNMLDRFHGKRGVTTKFADLVQTCNKFEVSRLFLATLQLANNGNVQIAEGNRGVCGMELTLLTDVENSVKDNIGALIV